MNQYNIFIYNDILSILQKHTNDINPVGKLTKNNKPYISAKCNICKKMKSKFVSVKNINGSGFLSNIFKNIPVLNTIF